MHIVGALVKPERSSFEGKRRRQTVARSSPAAVASNDLALSRPVPSSRSRSAYEPARLNHTRLPAHDNDFQRPLTSRHNSIGLPLLLQRKALLEVEYRRMKTLKGTYDGPHEAKEQWFLPGWTLLWDAVLTGVSTIFDGVLSLLDEQVGSGRR